MTSKNYDRCLAMAVLYLMELEKYEYAKLLLTCELEVSQQKTGTDIVLRGSEEFCDKWEKDTYDDIDSDGETYKVHGKFRRSILIVLEALIDFQKICRITAVMGTIKHEAPWRSQYLGIIEAEAAITNQNPWAKKPIEWKGMRFTSQPEVEIAKVLEYFGVTYIPTTLVRVGDMDYRQTLIPDFLICEDGKWGILEVDGQTYHRGTATQDYERMRKLTQHVAHFDRYPASRCMSEPFEVVDEFLRILRMK